MTTYRRNSGDGLRALFRDLTHGRRFNRGAAWGMIILVALLAFEVSNFNATRFALRDILGDLSFGGLQWATILAIAFCGIDFAGIARVFTPEQGADEPKEVYYLFGAWLLAAGFNAILTWWGVSVAIVNHTSASGGAVISNETMTKVVPIFVAAMILLIRVLIIGSFSLAGDRMFTTAERSASERNNYARPAQQQTYRPANQGQPILRPASSLNRPVQTTQNQSYRPAPKPAQQTSFMRAEPTYHSVNEPSNDRNYNA
ncbi:MAG: hypothetical protein CNIPEHKO_01306 [Anaerolineales bacterium]|nr:hypothetical protein [Anaerolineae bacterium]MBL8106500.1 hypothetical protein [Anaerolineales bacterium]MBV6401009.1 hypothetical protein [Anaerolineales bacterium]MCC7190589.1 hypothetical protein [Anaerolineales bacterium]